MGIATEGGAEIWTESSGVEGEDEVGHMGTSPDSVDVGEMRLGTR